MHSLNRRFWRPKLTLVLSTLKLKTHLKSKLWAQPRTECNTTDRKWTLEARRQPTFSQVRVVQSGAITRPLYTISILVRACCTQVSSQITWFKCNPFRLHTPNNQHSPQDTNNTNRPRTLAATLFRGKVAEAQQDTSTSIILCSTTHRQTWLIRTLWVMEAATII